MSSGMDEILGIFFEEASGSIDELERLFLGLDEQSDPTAFKAVFRVAHNIKGSSKSVGMANMGRVTHELETLLIRLGEGKLKLGREMKTVLLSAIDSLKELLDRAQSTGRDDGSVEDIISRLRGVLAEAQEDSLIAELKGAQDGDIIFIDPVPLLESVGKELGTSLSLQDGKVISPETGTHPDAQLGAPSSQPRRHEPAAVSPVHPEQVAHRRTPAGQKGSGETVRVPTHRIDQLQNHVGEILVLQSVLTEQLRDHPSPLVRNALRQMKKVTREVQDSSMGLRLVSLKNLLVKLTRAVHDAAGALGKEVDFITYGEDTEVDKVLNEGLADPLMHMVRNAVDHGLETPDERMKAGKSNRGRIELTARSEGSFLVVELRDDGRGLDEDAIIKKATAKGLIAPGAALAPKQIFALIFEPGFSTKAQVSEVSGRGVGMDVVQTNVHAMRGHIDISSAKGKGSVFTLTIPLAISLLDGMVIRLGEEKWILPLHMVTESFRLLSCKIESVVGVGKVLNLRGESIPLVDLGVALGALGERSPPSEQVVIVSKDKDVRVALLVDSVLGIQTVVSKPLTAEMQARPGLSGCAILGDGKTSLILEVGSLHKSLSSRRRVA